MEPSTNRLAFLVHNLSASALQLFLHISLQAGGPNREIEIRYREIRAAIGRSERSIVKDKAELQRKGICEFVAEANQHRRARASIPQAYWPTELLGAAHPRPAEHQHLSISDAPAYERDAFDRLSGFGIHPETARNLVRTISPAKILDTIEYIEYRARVPGSRIHSPQGMLIHYLRESVPLPESFISTRQIQAKQAAEELQEKERCRIQILECEYDEWCLRHAEQELRRRYTEQDLDIVLEGLAHSLQREYSQLSRMTKAIQKDVARRHLLKTIRAELCVPSFDEWLRTSDSESR